MLKKTLIIWILIFSAFSIYCVADKNELLLKFQNFHRKFPQEKVYLRSDRSVYAAGDTIWVAASAFSGSDHLPDPNIRTLYAELISPDNIFLYRLKIELKDGNGSVDFPLSPDLKEGVYQLRAYSDWMKNFEEAFLFRKNIFVYNWKESRMQTGVSFNFLPGEQDSVKAFISLLYLPDDQVSYTNVHYVFNNGSENRKGVVQTNNRGQCTIKIPVESISGIKPSAYLDIRFMYNEREYFETFHFPENSTNLSLYFFPEGGDLIHNIVSKVGFKAVDYTGRPVEVEGSIMDEDHKEITTFKSVHDGMGQFLLMPQPGKKYYAFITKPDGVKQIFTLPEVKKEGFALSIRPASEKILVEIKSNYPNLSSERLTLIGHSRGEIGYVWKFDSRFSPLVVAVPTKKFPTGIVHFTLFYDEQPVSERLVFVNHHDELKISIQPEKQVFRTRSKVNLDLEVRDDEGNVVEGNFSLVIQNADNLSLEDEYQTNIQNYLLLSSDLKGEIHQPGYYFDPNNPSAPVHLDILMMTQGWRRFVWKQILQEDKMTHLNYVSDRGLKISGKVLKSNNKPVPNSIVNVQFHNSHTNEFIYVESDKEGRFEITDLHYYGQARFFISATNPKGNSNVVLLMDEDNPPPLREYKLNNWGSRVRHIDYFLEKAMEREKVARAFNFNNLDRILDEIVVSGKKEDQPILYKIYNNVDATIQVDDISAISATNVFQLLQNRVPGVHVVDRSVIIRGTRSLTGSNEPLFLLDGSPIDILGLETINPYHIDHIDVLKGASAAVFGARGGNGVIAFYTKNNLASQEDNYQAKNQVKTSYEGYYKSREFYVPDYDVPKEEHIKPDFRPVLYFNPLIKTSKEGKASISFYSSDETGRYKVLIEGISKGGISGVSECTFEVVK